MPALPDAPRSAKDWPIPPMDHAAGAKPSAFTWAMGRLILQRMGDRETMKAITADPRMPAYCTVFRWVKVVPEFGDAYRQVRLALAQARQQEADARRAALSAARARAAIAKGKWPRAWVSGRKSSYTPALARAVCEAVEEGWALSAVLRRPGMPSSKAVYGWLRRRADFRAMYVEACRRRTIGFELRIDMLIDEAAPGVDLRMLDRRIAALKGRIGRLTPKVYRPAARRRDF
jgi:hypothetical protein